MTLLLIAILLVGCFIFRNPLAAIGFAILIFWIAGKIWNTMDV